MHTWIARLGIVLFAAFVLAGCGANAGESAAKSTVSSTSSTSSSSAGSASARPTLSILPSARPARAIHTAPSTASMVCGAEIRSAVAKLVGAQSIPAGVSSWNDNLFTCTYRLADGPLVLAVRVADSTPFAQADFKALQAVTPGAVKIIGLQSFGLPGFFNHAGVVSFTKDDFTLKVDATAMQPKIGAHQQNRADFAYGVAADVMACWSE